MDFYNRVSEEGRAVRLKELRREPELTETPSSSPADLVERDGVVAQRQTDRQPADLLDGHGTPSPKLPGGHTPKHKL